MILGITCSSIFQSEFNYSFADKEIKSDGKYSYELKNIKIFEKNNFQELTASFKIYNNNKFIAKIEPSKRYYNVSKMITTEAGYLSLLVSRIFIWF